MENNSFTRTFSFTGNSQKIILVPGTYIFECWGAQGNIFAWGNGGKGAYTKGIISLKKRRSFYVFVGEHGKTGVDGYSFNGGGYSQSSGGGASDIRLKDGNWDDFYSLKSRIIVAAGGGGPDSSENGGAGGCLNRIGTGHSNGGTQTSGGSSNGARDGSFGKGGIYRVLDGSGCGAGGGGYYGGGASTGDYAGAGGSSFISGHPGCDAISKESEEGHPIHTKQPNHYSGLIFRSTLMIDGNSQMPSPTSSTKETGHSLHGNVRITIVKFNQSDCTKSHKKTIDFLLSLTIIIAKS